MSSVCAVVVTHNRRESLRRCLDALASQRRRADRILVVDNASTDGTRVMLEREYPAVEVLALPTNQGGAGGFHEGMKRAHAQGCDWLWLLDDDTIPAPDALAELLSVAAQSPRHRPPLLASKVLWRDGRFHPMNFPTPDRARIAGVIDAAERGLMPFRACTFVSVLVHRGVVDRHGLPFKHFYIWSDDIEYTSRAILGGELGYLVPASVVLHDTANAHTAETSPPERFYYHVRNTLFMIRGPARPRRDKLLRTWVLLKTTVGYLLTYPRPASVRAILRGLRDGLSPLTASSRSGFAPPTAPARLQPDGRRTTASPPAPGHRRSPAAGGPAGPPAGA